MKKLISIVTPFYNEEKSISDYFRIIEKFLSQIKDFDYEIIAVDDGSSDSTYELLQAIANQKKNLTVIKLSRNFGKEFALTAGLDYATGDTIIPIDADLQDPPNFIPQMVEKWREGYKVVIAKRTSRHDPLLKKITAALFYKLAHKIMDCSLPQNVGDFRLIDKVVLEDIKKIRERNRFMRGIFSWVGYKTATIEYERRARTSGKSKYNYPSMIKYALDGIFSFSTFPIKAITYSGLIISLCSFGYMLITIYDKLSGRTVPGYASLMSVILFLGGINFIFIGIVGEYVGRIFNETKGRPLYLVEEVIRNKKQN